MSFAHFPNPPRIAAGWGERALLLAMLAVLALASAGGCASTSCFLPVCLDQELATRTGAGLGPAFCPDEIALPEGVSLEKGITEEDAALIALWNNPGYRELLSDLAIAEADVIQASQLANPQLTNLIPLSVKQWEAWLILPVDVIALRPARVRMAQLEENRVSQRLVQDGLNVVRDARTAFVDLRLAESLFELAETTESEFRELARIGRERVKAGAAAEVEIAPLAIEAHTTRERELRSRLEIEVIRERMMNVLGLSQANVRVKSAQEPIALRPELPACDAQMLVAEALEQRPDLRAVEAAIAAADQRHSLAWWDYLGINMYLPDLNSKGDKGFEAGPGIQFFVPIMHRNQGMKARTAADRERLERQLARFANTAAFEVRQALLRVEQARQSHALWHDDVLPRAEAAAQSAREALKDDGATLFAVVDSTRQLALARQRVLETQAELDRAVIELERSVGHRLRVDPAHRAEELPPPVMVAPEEVRP